MVKRHLNIKMFPSGMVTVCSFKIVGSRSEITIKHRS